jgi:DNA modification methylase
LIDEDAVPDAPPEPIVRSGDLWCLGEHKLFVGDATKVEDVGKLMGTDMADLVFTDPPYNCDYEGYTDEHMVIQNDRMSESDFKRFLASTFQAYRRIVKRGASLYICHPSLWQREFQNAMETAGFEIRCQIIWAKNTFAWGFGRYNFQHEPIFYAHIRKCCKPKGERVW